jgi:hypothetical protein
MSKIVIRYNPKFNEVFDELDQLLDFCRDYGYRYNEADLHNFKSYAWQQFSKFQQGKNAKNMWDEDLRKLVSKY